MSSATFTLLSVAQSRFSSADREAMRNARNAGVPLRELAARYGVHPSTILRASKIVDKVRTRSEFVGSLAVRPPQRQQPVHSWSLEMIRAARDDQLAGNFARPVQLAQAMRTDDALFVAYHNRIAPQSAVAGQLVPASGTRGVAVAKKAACSVFTPRTVLAGIVGTLANHGVAIGYVEQEPNDEGTRVDFRLTEWPLEFVRWNASKEILEATTRNMGTVPIVHGDGRWIIFRKFDVKPWTQEACVLPGALLWAAHANGVKDWAAASTSHGQAKVVGELPAGIALQGEEGLTAEAQAFLTLLQDIVSGESGAGIRPAGSKTEFVANGSTAWQVFSELILSREKAAARIYLGSDAFLGSVGGAPGVDIAALFGVATTKIQGDFDALSRGLKTGLYEPWAAVNEGDSRYAPSLFYELPDPDAAKKHEEYSVREEKFFAAVEAYRKNGFMIDQDVIDRLAKEHGITAPTLAAGESRAVPIPLAPTDMAKVVRVGAALRSLGLEPFGDARDGMTITELDELNKAKAAAKEAAAAAQAEAKNAPPPAQGAPTA
jgi:hypothetical protein